VLLQGAKVRLLPVKHGSCKLLLCFPGGHAGYVSAACKLGGILYLLQFRFDVYANYISPPNSLLLSGLTRSIYMLESNPRD